MGLFGKSRPHICEMLDEQKAELDRTFGSDDYTVEKTSDYSAILKTKVAEIEFTDDPRDFVAASILSVSGTDVIESPIGTWARFLGEDPPLQKRSDSYQKQLAKELNWIALITDRILKDEAKTRDAAWFVKGYNRAYNDWASAKGSWAEPDFKD